MNSRTKREVLAAEKRVLRHAMICWKYDPATASLVGYTKRYDRLLMACEALAKVRRK